MLLGAKTGCSILLVDRLNYRRPMPVYLADMQELKTSDFEIWKYLGEGNFSVTKSKIPFTSIGVDHAREQVNKILKSDGGLCGISSNENKTCVHGYY